MRVTAVLPLHNHEKYVCDAIRSVLSQTVKPQSVVIVNNGSQDKSKQVVLDFMGNPPLAKQLDHVKLYGVWMGEVELVLLSTQKALGPSAARNLGIQSKWDTTDIYALLDSDDLYRPTKIEESLKCFKEFSPHVGVVYSDYETFSDTIRTRQYKEPYSKERLFQECIVNCDSLVSKAAFAKTGLFAEDMRVCEDYQMWVRISEYFMMHHIPKALVDIRVGSHSATTTVPKQVWEENYRKVFQKVADKARGI